uniref:uncharacterized protein LOC100175415 isoform X3 n=1 Tax=Ciona intestinalis TaxID=7719 RepID=UPI000EF448EA|nr:uncharacterized protein LOC100175415 isoform X3 [Ciona intestinalis]|eukprot:XP_026691713.1 uncharacterized protein LOC100175415 isoform X3 [Ciona intestinalis]
MIQLPETHPNFKPKLKGPKNKISPNLKRNTILSVTSGFLMAISKTLNAVVVFGVLCALPCAYFENTNGIAAAEEVEAILPRICRVFDKEAASTIVLCRRIYETISQWTNDDEQTHSDMSPMKEIAPTLEYSDVVNGKYFVKRNPDAELIKMMRNLRRRSRYKHLSDKVLRKLLLNYHRRV